MRSRSLEVFDPLLSNNLDSNEFIDCSSKKFDSLSVLSQKTNKKRRIRNKTKQENINFVKLKKKYQQKPPGSA